MYPRPFGPYMLLERLGVGGMSEVDLARRTVEDAGFVRLVVIKRIKTDRSTDPAFVRMFRDEARITSELHHANIGQLFDMGRHGDEYYLVLEYVPGVDVRYLINALRERQQRVPVRVALRILCDVLEALQYAHTKRDQLGREMEIVHRDVNPRNIMVSIRGDVKLIDFGVAKAVDRFEKTRTDHIKGKFNYMAPEQLKAEAVDHRADLYAVGLCLHEFLSGASPYFGLNQLQILHRMTSGHVPAMPAVAELPYADALKRVHDRALHPNPDRRYQDARAFREELEAVAQQVGGLPSRESLARFLRQVDAQAVDRIEQKMKAYASLEVSASSEITEPIPERADLSASTARNPSWGSRSGTAGPAAQRQSGDAAGSSAARLAAQMEEIRSQPLPTAGPTLDATSPSITRTSVLAGGLVLASASGMVGALAAVVLVLALGWWWFGQAGLGPTDQPVAAVHQTPPSPAPQVAPADPETARPGPQPTAQLQEAPSGTPDEVEEVSQPAPAPAAPAPPRPVTPKPSPAPAPKVTPTPAPAPPPTPQPEPASEATDPPGTAEVPEPAAKPPEPAAAPAPAGSNAQESAPQPEPAETGTLRITAVERGRAILIDGRPTGKVTPTTFDWEVGRFTVQVEGFEPQAVELKAKQVRVLTFK